MTEKQAFFGVSTPAGAVETRIAEEKRPCRACGTPLWFIRTRAGKLLPMCADGVSHFANCPNADQFRRPPK